MTQSVNDRLSFRPVIPGPGQVLTAHKSDPSPAPATNDEPRFCHKCNVSHLSSALDALISILSSDIIAQRRGRTLMKQ